MPAELTLPVAVSFVILALRLLVKVQKVKYEKPA